MFVNDLIVISYDIYFLSDLINPAFHKRKRHTHQRFTADARGIRSTRQNIRMENSEYHAYRVKFNYSQRIIQAGEDGGDKRYVES